MIRPCGCAGVCTPTGGAEVNVVFDANVCVNGCSVGPFVLGGVSVSGVFFSIGPALRMPYFPPPIIG